MSLIGRPKCEKLRKEGEVVLFGQWTKFFVARGEASAKKQDAYYCDGTKIYRSMAEAVKAYAGRDPDLKRKFEEAEGRSRSASPKKVRSPARVRKTSQSPARKPAAERPRAASPEKKTSTKRPRSDPFDLVDVPVLLTVSASDGVSPAFGWDGEADTTSDRPFDRFVEQHWQHLPVGKDYPKIALAVRVAFHKAEKEVSSQTVPIVYPSGFADDRQKSALKKALALAYDGARYKWTQTSKKPKIEFLRVAISAKSKSKVSPTKKSPARAPSVSARKQSPGRISSSKRSPKRFHSTGREY